MITLRLDPKLEQAIQNTAKNLGLTKSELIRKSISEYLGKLSQPSPWELGEDIFGKYSSGLSNLSTNRKELLKNKIRAKRK
ncbi:ribbon-helix-helix protein, CopG family [Desulfurivibrio dismutans]|uniref:ribbon-helix-helix protein, CopG family n=1 Tax=Desulfurivibrio dismutans TaxID=1398908 RepID=UPI0023DCA4FE|nr:ribbon-helix-helix protein, CopG family [Desulfurivibrio alkaliphilus]MDF1615094.1 ribbon-helix-helix protein, CopG family [Desulfurivibrio alkaliphilus]